MNNSTLNLNKISDYCSAFGCQCLNEQITVIDSVTELHKLNDVQINYRFYTLYLKTGGNCSMIYGKQQHDYNDGSLVCFAPDSSFTMHYEQEEDRPSYLGLIFTKDFIQNTDLEFEINNYTFLKYFPQEALHLDENQITQIKDVLLSLKDIITEDLTEKQKKEIVVLIKELLNRCKEYYSLQFENRVTYHKQVILKFQNLLDGYFNNNYALMNGLPTVSYFSDKICLSYGYFGDLIKKELGVSVQKIIQNAIIEKAKYELKHTNKPIKEISDYLGFEYPQHFARLFKNTVSMTPSEYRNSQ